MAETDRRTWIFSAAAALAAVSLDALVSPGRGFSAIEDDPMQSMAKVQKDMKVGYDQLKSLLKTLTLEQKTEFCKLLDERCTQLLKSKIGQEESKKELELSAATTVRDFSKLDANSIVSRCSVSVEKGMGVATIVLGVAPNERTLSIDDKAVVREIAINLYLQRVNNHRQHQFIEGVIEQQSLLLKGNYSMDPR